MTGSTKDDRISAAVKSGTRLEGAICEFKTQILDRIKQGKFTGSISLEAILNRGDLVGYDITTVDKIRNS